MAFQWIRKIRALELEEQILNAGSIVGFVGVLLPWLSGEWLGGESVTYSGFGFHTSFIGIAIFILNLFVLLITLIPLTGGPALVRRRSRDIVRLCASTQATILVLAALSVITKVTFEFSRMEVRFGIYVALIGSLVASLYSFLRVQEQRRSQVHELFHHPEDHTTRGEQEAAVPVPPPPPPAPDPEEHRLIH